MLLKDVGQVDKHFMDVLVDVIAVNKDVVSCQEFFNFPSTLMIGPLHCKRECEGLVDLISHCLGILSIVLKPLIDQLSQINRELSQPIV